ncbi:unnamed protein product [Caretta caretta]
MPVQPQKPLRGTAGLARHLPSRTSRPHPSTPGRTSQRYCQCCWNPLLQGNEDTIYLQYPLTADVVICPICSSRRIFHLFGGITRHLKRCHSKRVTFSCALRDPEAMQDARSRL